MTNLRDEMRKVIQDGIDGWFDACFMGNVTPVDAITKYPLTRDNAIVVYKSRYSYQSIEDEFIDGIDPDTAISSQLLQAWINYHWHYAHLELAEDFSSFKGIPITEDIELRRQNFRNELIGKGYKQVKL